MDASNLLKPALAKGEIRCIGSTTYKEYRNYFEKDRALVRRFQKIDVHEPSKDDAVKILMASNPITRSITMSPIPTRDQGRGRSLLALYRDRKLPDKAIDVIDESGASQMLLPPDKRKTVIDIDDVEAIIAKWHAFPPRPSATTTAKPCAISTAI